jgi:hypothetical protein
MLLTCHIGDNIMNFREIALESGSMKTISNRGRAKFRARERAAQRFDNSMCNYIYESAKKADDEFFSSVYEEAQENERKNSIFKTLTFELCSAFLSFKPSYFGTVAFLLPREKFLAFIWQLI